MKSFNKLSHACNRQRGLRRPPRTGAPDKGERVNLKARLKKLERQHSQVARERFRYLNIPKPGRGSLRSTEHN
jgi:hypothetical protein